jgi:hypothetical protein
LQPPARVPSQYFRLLDGQRRFPVFLFSVRERPEKHETTERPGPDLQEMTPVKGLATTVLIAGHL